MREPEKQLFETKDGQVEVTLNQLGGIASGLLMVRLAKAHASAIGKMGLAFAGGGSVKLALDAFSDLASGLDEREFERLLLELTKGGQALVNGEFEDLNRVLIDRMFTGHPEGVFELLWFGMRVNYENFFERLADLAKKFQPKATPTKATDHQTA